MKRSHKYTTIFIAAFFLMITSSPLFAEKMTDNWRVTGYTKYRDAVFADIARLTSPTPDTKAIWVKISPAKKSQYLQLINEYLEKVNKSGKGFRSIEILCEINCSRHLIRFVKFAYFDNSGNIIHVADETNLQWFSILQGNIWFNVEKEACAERK